jgi:hypothetical protein
MNYKLLGKSGLRVSELSQFEDNLRCLESSLEARHIARLNEISHIELGFPMDFLHRKQVRDFLHGGLFDRIQPGN